MLIPFLSVLPYKSTSSVATSGLIEGKRVARELYFRLYNDGKGNKLFSVTSANLNTVTQEGSNIWQLANLELCSNIKCKRHSTFLGKYRRFV